MSSNIEFQKKCMWCGEIFTAYKSSTLYCCHRCANLAYKERKRQDRNIKLQDEFNNQAKKTDNILKEYLTPTEVSCLLNIGRTSTYRYIRDGVIKAMRFKGKTLIRKSDIDSMFDYIISENPTTKRLEKTPITEFYTTSEIKKKFKVSESWIFIQAKKHQVPKTSSKGKTLWSKKHIDKYFSVKATTSEITEWYTADEVQTKFDMKLSTIYDFVYRNHIPKKKEAGAVYYSAKHFDIAKGIIKAEEPQYYMVAEAMEKFNLTRDQLYHYVKYHKIPKVKFGKYTKISKPELDKLFEAPKID